MRPGRYISLEGIDGAGTTTQSKLTAQWLRSKGRTVIETFEPTDRAVGKIIRQALAARMPGREGVEIEPQLFALLFAADRLDNTSATVAPALERGDWVVSDRCYLSSFAYQSLGCDLDWVRSLNRCCRRADLIILLDLDPRTAYERFATKRARHDVFERIDRLTAIRANYLKVAALLEREGERIVRIDASASVEAVAAAVQQAASELL